MPIILGNQDFLGVRRQFAFEFLAQLAPATLLGGEGGDYESKSKKGHHYAHRPIHKLSPPQRDGTTHRRNQPIFKGFHFSMGEFNFPLEFSLSAFSLARAPASSFSSCSILDSRDLMSPSALDGSVTRSVNGPTRLDPTTTIYFPVTLTSSNVSCPVFTVASVFARFAPVGSRNQSATCRLFPITVAEIEMLWPALRETGIAAP